MPIRIDTKLTPRKLVPAIERLFELSAGKIRSIEETWKPEQGAPVFTVKGRCTSRGWTEWTQGFQYGSAVAGLRDCLMQHASATPRLVWNPDIPNPTNFHDNWERVPDDQPFDNAFKVQWEFFLRHVVLNEPFRWNLLEGTKGVQLAEKGLESRAKRCWIDIPELKP